MVPAAGQMPGRRPLGAGPGIGVGVIQIRIDPAFPMPFLHAHHLAHHVGLVLLFGRYLGTAARLTAGAVRRRCLITHGHALHTGWAPGASPAATIIWPGSPARTCNRGNVITDSSDHAPGFSATSTTWLWEHGAIGVGGSRPIGAASR